MNKQILKLNKERIYRCAICPYRSRETGFCGFCMQKLIDEMRKPNDETPKKMNEM